MLMVTLAERYAKTFCIEYQKHRWPKPKRRNKGYTSSEWTKQMYRILEKTATSIGLKRKRTELRRIDLTWYKGEEDTPDIMVEHENGYKGIWKEEIPKLLSSNADLKVLICYPPKKEYWTIARKFTSKINDERRLKKTRTRSLYEEFLLIMGKQEETFIHKAESFVIYIYTPAFSVKRFRSN
jgi:hypothetical protein